jgi:hypothetical protein
MGIATHERLVATAVAALLVVGAVLVLYDLTRSNRPSDRRCAELWNGPASQTSRSLVRGRTFPLATVRGIEPNKAGQPGCVVLLRERQDGPWMLIGAVLTETGVFWDGGVTGVQYGTDSPSGGADGTPNATLHADGGLTLSDR